MPELLLSGQDLAKAFGAAPLFEGLSFGIFEGDHIGLVGPNGSGKTTLLKILAGLEPPSAGTRSVRKRLRIGYVPQDPVFAPETTVGSALHAAAGEVEADPHERDGRIAVAMGKAGFEDAEQTAASLSGGWKKRLAIACALAREPELLLLDEPSEGLAPLVVEHLGEQISRLKREGLTILLAEQNVDFSLELADRVYVLDKGTVRYDGTAQAFRADESIRHQYLAL